MLKVVEDLKNPNEPTKVHANFLCVCAMPQMPKPSIKTAHDGTLVPKTVRLPKSLAKLVR